MKGKESKNVLMTFILTYYEAEGFCSETKKVIEEVSFDMNLISLSSFPDVCSVRWGR